ncbi:hypothetical protein Hypma_006882 [Hypsizygus marmoreus]|uniref:Uncharacterized protein n=1 Tax=Hypsizygus marmoreus TaxID=39966 RepID=A0A369JTL8_HYPMA|nr:hypothetical protein Hypma_006882 [Hypsizygus marmoreus]
MHQEHHVPWDALASTFTYIPSNPHHTPRTTGFFPRNLPGQGQTLNHFTRVLAHTIKTFSDTERTKYPVATSFAAPSTGKLFSDELRDKYPLYLDETNQRIEYWIERAKPTHASPADPATQKPTYTTSDARLADVVKVLIAENQLTPLLTLAHHPHISMRHLLHLSWGHHFGWSRVGEAALHAYIIINLFAATHTLESGAYLGTKEYRRLNEELLSSMDFPAQQIPHREFLEALVKDKETGLPEVHHDYAALKRYLARVFELLYRYDMVVRECGVDPEWEGEIVGTFDWMIGMGKVKVEELWIDDKYIKRFA